MKSAILEASMNMVNVVNVFSVFLLNELDSFDFSMWMVFEFFITCIFVLDMTLRFIALGKLYT